MASKIKHLWVALRKDDTAKNSSCRPTELGAGACHWYASDAKSFARRLVPLFKSNTFAATKVTFPTHTTNLKYFSKQNSCCREEQARISVTLAGREDCRQLRLSTLIYSTLSWGTYENAYLGMQTSY